jgi:hypothetical protein
VVYNPFHADGNERMIDAREWVGCCAKKKMRLAEEIDFILL